MLSTVKDNILSFWLTNMVDNERGGFYGQMRGDGTLVADADKGGILNARILWSFSAAYRVLHNPEYLSAARRNPEAVCSLSELEECVSGGDAVESELENRRVGQAISDFLWQQEEEKRVIFLRRYWYFESIDDICRRSGYSRSKVTSMLHQTRKKLRTYLEKEGIEV